MEGKKSFVDELFPKREAAQQTKSDILSSIFPPRATGGGKDSSHPDFSGAWRKQGAEGNPRGNPSKNQSSGKKHSNPVYLYELPESCLMSSSVYYGGRDDFIPESSSNNSSSYFKCKKDKEDDSANTDAATRGDWWQGSYYY